MEKGDKVKFVGEKEEYTVETQRILRRVGEVIQTKPDDMVKLRSGEVRVMWIPKTKRGYPEFYRHRVTDLEVII